MKPIITLRIMTAFIVILLTQNAQSNAPICRDFFRKTAVSQNQKRLDGDGLSAGAVEFRTNLSESIKSLARLKLNLDLSQDKSGPKLTALSHVFRQKEVELIELLQANQIMTKEELLVVMQNEIQRLQAVEWVTERSERAGGKSEIELAIIDGSRAIFQKISPGQFFMGEVGKQVSTEITKPFAIMATPTTQIIWKKISEAALKRFDNKFSELNTEPSKHQGDLKPVEQVSYDDIQIWLQALNELSAAHDPIVKAIIPSHQEGDIYRLPTEAEWEFVARNRGVARGTFHFGDDVKELSQYAWYGRYPGPGPKPVATKNPLVIDGQEIYDIHGNVSEWTGDAMTEGQLPPGGRDPFVAGNAESPYRVVRGGGWGSPEFFMSISTRAGTGPFYRNHSIGFRLAKTSKIYGASF